MLIPAKYRLTPKISELLASIEASRSIIDSITIPPEIEMNIRRLSTLKSSLFSARIEGNDLTMDDFASTPSRDQKKIEVNNILKALTLVHRQSARDMSVKTILELHEIALNGLVSELGRFRSEVSAIFNTAGIAIYMPPKPSLIKPLMERLVKFINTGRESFIPIKACLAHYSFEKIHPFLDGNGRVGRLTLQSVLHKGGYGMKGLISIEEYLDNHRASYYTALDDREKDVTDYLEFMLEAIAESATQAKALVLEKRESDVADFLLPRRAEIFHIIRDHKLINFDQIRRRFLKVNERTLRYDIKKLCDAGLVKKLGMTNGVYYQLVEK